MGPAGKEDTLNQEKIWQSAKSITKPNWWRKLVPKSYDSSCSQPRCWMRLKSHARRGGKKIVIFAPLKMVTISTFLQSRNGKALFGCLLNLLDLWGNVFSIYQHLAFPCSKKSIFSCCFLSVKTVDTYWYPILPPSDETEAPIFVVQFH